MWLEPVGQPPIGFNLVTGLDIGTGAAHLVLNRELTAMLERIRLANIHTKTAD